MAGKSPEPLKETPDFGGLLGQRGGDDGHGVDLLGVAAAGEVVDRGVQTQQNGSIGVKAAQALGNLITNVARINVGENKGVGIAGHGRAGELELAHGGGDGGVELHLAVDGQVGGGSLGLGAGVAHLVHSVTLAGALGGVAQVGHLGVNAEGFGALGALQADLHQLVLRGVDVDGAVAHGQHSVVAHALADHNEAGGDDFILGLGLDELQGGADGVGGGVGGAAQQTVGHAHLYQHGAEVVALHQGGAALVGGHLAAAQRHHLLHHLVHVGIGGGVDDLSTPDVLWYGSDPA